MKQKTVLVFGASLNKERYSNIAIHKLLLHQYKVKAFGNKAGKINEINIETKLIQFKGIHTITLYINPNLQKQYYNYLLNLKPKRIIFNPGTENTELLKLATINNIICQNACTLVMLSTLQF